MLPHLPEPAAAYAMILNLIQRQEKLASSYVGTCCYQSIMQISNLCITHSFQAHIMSPVILLLDRCFCAWCLCDSAVNMLGDDFDSFSNFSQFHIFSVGEKHVTSAIWHCHNVDFTSVRLIKITQKKDLRKLGSLTKTSIDKVFFVNTGMGTCCSQRLNWT